MRESPTALTRFGGDPMATDAIITATDVIVVLERLHCVREDDARGGSEPYLWPALVWYDDDTLATPGRVGVITPLSRDARVVLRSDMRAGQTADIPPQWGCCASASRPA
jgi:hypothetical protein